MNDKGCVGAPDWMIEIVSPSSRRMDYYTKLSLYRSANVREYWIVDPMKQTILVYDMEHDAAPIICLNWGMWNEQENTDKVERD